ncbi:MAG: carbohydrate ABC transporter substrate-binding protein [Geodermatophilaceae bacterium]|nr:carbohydrate ABC transporter substrate-binding protein [Geodermatophilaceae bacterium]
MRGRSTSKVIVLTVATLFTAGCLSEGGSGSDGGGSGGGGEASGTVTILGAFGGAEAEAFEASLEAFQEESGITVEFTGSSDFTTEITARVRGNNAPDIAIFPQPGLLLDIAATSDMSPLQDAIDLATIKETLVPGMAESTELDGDTYGVPMKMAVKSIVWTPKPAFADGGYTAPTTQTELLALSDQIKADGVAPWCIGIESGTATGWVATDWLEEYVLRIGGADFYQQWARHEVPFNDPIVVQAAEAFADIAFTEGNVFGGRESITSSGFGTAGNPMFEDPAQCYMHRQANFITSGDFYPAEVIADLDNRVSVFQLPPVEDGAAEGNSVLLGGDWATLFSPDNAEAVEVLEFLASPEFGGPWANVGGYLSPHTTFDATQYPDETTRQIFQFAVDSETTGIDGSDQMPGAVGAGSFWRGMTAWISGQEDLQTTLDGIEEGWPTS